MVDDADGSHAARRSLLAGVLLACAIATAACSPAARPASETAGERATETGPEASEVTEPASGAEIGAASAAGYADFMHLGGIEYGRVNDLDRELATVPRETVDLDREIGRVKFRWDGSEGRPPDHERKDGDAAYLDPGTPIYAVKGYEPSFRAAAPADGEWALYEAEDNPEAGRGEELLDIRGRINRIVLQDDEPSPGGYTLETVAIGDPEELEALVDAVLAAPVESTSDELGGKSIGVFFHHEDGTTTHMLYEVKSGMLSPSDGAHPSVIVTPREFRAAMEQTSRNYFGN